MQVGLKDMKKAYKNVKIDKIEVILLLFASFSIITAVGHSGRLKVSGMLYKRGWMKYKLY